MTRILYLSKTIQRICSIKNEAEKFLFTSCCFSIFLSIARVLYTHKITFLSLCWNLLLAFVPFFMSRLMTRHFVHIQNKWLFSVLFVVWLLFVPNSFYIITDLFHLSEMHATPLWFDTLLIMSFAWNGLLLGIWSIRHIEKMINVLWSIKNDWVLIYPIMFLNALGIYIGRYWRYNTWDIVSNPFNLMCDIYRIIFHPVQNKEVWIMVVGWSIFLSLLYAGLKKISKAIE